MCVCVSLSLSLSVHLLLQEDSRSSSQRRSPPPRRSSLSLDLDANHGSGSEPSGSESLEDGEILPGDLFILTPPPPAPPAASSFSLLSAVEERVGSSEVQGRLYLNKVFHISASKMFELLFSDSSFMRRFLNARKILSETFAPPVPFLFWISQILFCRLLFSLTFFLSF